MSTPHAIPPVTFEYDMEKVYRSISLGQDHTPLLISICGGVSDTQIVSDYCVLPSTDVTPQDGFSVFTTGIPGVWTGIDHQAMVWCHQMRWTLARILLEMTKTDDRQNRLLIARQWLLGEWEVKKSTEPSGKSVKIPVQSSEMTLLFKHNILVPALQHCDTQNHCEWVKGKIEVLPYPKNGSAPFPAPGEGIGQDETIQALSINLTSEDGELDFERSGLLAVGISEHHVATSGRWGE